MIPTKKYVSLHRARPTPARQNHSGGERRQSFGRGFTLVETLVYVAIFSIFVAGLVSFMNSISSTRIHNQIILEVNDQGREIISLITQTLRNASGVNSPTIGATASLLSLATILPSTSPTVFSTTGSTLNIKEGAGAQVALTNNKVAISNLVFSNLSRMGKPNVIKIRFTLSNITPSLRPQDNYTNHFYGSATLRK